MFSYVIQASALPWSRNELTEFSRTGLDVLHAGFYVGRRENFVKLHVALQVDLAGSWCTLEPLALALRATSLGWGRQCEENPGENVR
jgi:hypothetical protein